MKLISFTIFGSKLPIAINSDTVLRIGTMGEHSFIKFVDGGSIEVGESYEDLLSKLKASE